MWAFGSNREGQLGEASLGDQSAIPTLVLGPGSQHRDAGLLQPAVGIAAGARHSCVVNTLGQCVAWGWSLYGEWVAVPGGGGGGSIGWVRKASLGQRGLWYR